MTYGERIFEVLLDHIDAQQLLWELVDVLNEDQRIEYASHIAKMYDIDRPEDLVNEDWN